MKNLFNPDWAIFLKEEIEQTYFIDLMQTIDLEYQRNICYPPKELIFSSFNQCPIEKLKVVIIGQDPYHGEGEANGLSFSVNDGMKIPPSLRNIYRELIDDLDSIFMPSSGNLEDWAKQGVLLLNSSLSVQKDQPNSHKHLNWNRFTDAVIERIASENQNIVFILWGSFAQKKGSKIDKTLHLVLESGHPSPMSANQGKWFGNKHFSKTNNYLREHGKEPIVWLK